MSTFKALSSFPLNLAKYFVWTYILLKKRWKCEQLVPTTCCCVMNQPTVRLQEFSPSKWALYNKRPFRGAFLCFRNELSSFIRIQLTTVQFISTLEGKYINEWINRIGYLDATNELPWPLLHTCKGRVALRRTNVFSSFSSRICQNL